jgi:hypothetical protein
MSIPNMQQTPAPQGKPPIGERLKALLAEWGPLLLVVWFGLFAIVLVGFVVAIESGFKVESTAGALGTWGAAYVATQLTKPLRFAATVVITPALGTFLKRFRRKRAPNTGAEPPAAELSTREPPVRELP